MTETERIILDIKGRPQAKGRPRFNTTTGMVYTDGKTRQAERILQAEMRDACPTPLDGPLEVVIWFRFKRPESWAKDQKTQVDEWGAEPWFQGKPDGDNLEKTVWDAAKGILWGDDAQVVRWLGMKVYSSESSTRILITQLEER